jgi:hypothetical protein
METGLFLACYISLVNARGAFSPTVSGMECSCYRTRGGNGYVLYGPDFIIFCVPWADSDGVEAVHF